MNEKIPLITVCGPTASGKTAVAVSLAKRLDGEVVSADSMQVYKYMDIGTAKPTKAEMDGVPHHMLDFLGPGEAFSVADYVRLAGKAVGDIASRGKRPILAGGTGLYISSLINGVGFEDMPGGAGIREELEAAAREKENAGEYLRGLLNEIDPELAASLHPNDRGRIIRAIEVYRLTGITMTEHQRRSREKPGVYEPLIIGLTFSDRQLLYDRIDSRVDGMMESGLLEEARLLRDQYSRTAAQAIGYKELAAYFRGEESLETAAETIKRETRRYAKRQLTWLRREKSIRWFNMDDPESMERITTLAEEFAGGGTSGII
ncbi:tRNA dimethylallyltransferase [Clostridia bacterium]|nr:tRNA dimethylallyltransferase [Clostridia bacterium]